jgi:hypothetical protein
METIKAMRCDAMRCDAMRCDHKFTCGLAYFWEKLSHVAKLFEFCARLQRYRLMVIKGLKNVKCPLRLSTPVGYIYKKDEDMATTHAIGKGLTFEKVRAAILATNEQMKETDRRIGKLTNRFGEVVEYMIGPNLTAKFRELQFEFEKTSRDVKIENREHNIFAEIDAFLENGDKVMAVEIKSKPNSDDINEHAARMDKLRKNADLHGDKRKYLGAIAGVVFGDSEKMYALKKAFM